MKISTKIDGIVLNKTEKKQLEDALYILYRNQNLIVGNINMNAFEIVKKIAYRHGVDFQL